MPSCLFLLLAAAATADGAETEHGEPAASNPERTTESGWRAAWHAEALAFFREQTAAARDEASAPVSAAADDPVLRSPLVPDPDIVVLEPITVTARADTADFERALRRNSTAPRAAPRLPGTGVLMSHDIGPVRMYLGSIFYLPVLAGISW